MCTLYMIPCFYLFVNPATSNYKKRLKGVLVDNAVKTW